MRFDTIIIGGGLSGLTAGLRLQKAGQKTAIISAGQNALHFSSGVFGVLKEDSVIPEGHPYTHLPLEKYLEEVKPFFLDAGIRLGGDPLKNGWRLTPSGTMQEGRFSLEEATLFSAPDEFKATKALIVNIPGFLDFNTAFLADGLAKRGIPARVACLDVPELTSLRTSPSEMRSVNISRVADSVSGKVAEAVKALLKDEDLVILPQVFGLQDAGIPARIAEAIPSRVLFIGTMPPSVPGIRTQLLLKRAYERAGGTFLMGDEAIAPVMDETRVKALRTVNLGEQLLQADHYILASGSFFSKGLASSMQKIYEPLFGLDVEFPDERTQWYDLDFFAPQAYGGFGVVTDEKFRALKAGRVMENLYVAGSVLARTYGQQLGCGGGVAILTALATADNIMEAQRV
ncbi:MAG: anaerobic glycerol-3-phosphate dehydrogenase subunit B [Bacteroidales bacterium]|nr:anaerobic glycerol-3-phosphate dehydrogenase subunit B [Bacteroidales bacterium]